MRKILLLLAALLVAPAANASIVLETSVTDMSRLATLVVRGEVVQTQAFRPEGKQVHTRVSLHVSEVLKGRVSTDMIEVILPGGTMGDIGVRVPGTPRFRVGEEVVVFLEKRLQGYVVCGQEQGRFDIRRDTGDKKPMAVRSFSRGLSLLRPGDPSAASVSPKDDARRLAELRDAVRAAVIRHGARPEPIEVVFRA